MENNLLFDYGPVWIKKKRQFYKKYMDIRNYPLPGGITCGPVITQSIILDDESQNTGLEDTRQIRREVNCTEVANRNCIEKKFPLNFAPSLKPLQTTASQFVLPGSLKERFHHASVLSSYTLNEEDHIVYGQSSSESSTLNIASVVTDISGGGEELILNNVRQVFKYQTLCQSNSTVINGTPHLLLRVDNELRLVKIKEDTFDLCSIPETNVLDCCLSSDFSDRFAFINGEGTVNLFDVDREKNLWSGKLDGTVQSDAEYLGCEFAYHPSYINVASKSEVILADTRIPLNNCDKRTLFAINKMNNYLYGHDEFICAIKNVPNIPFLYVTCSNTLALVDSRYCKYPVLTWCHMIRGRPSFAQYFEDRDFHFHVVADPLKSQLCIVSSKSDCAEYPSVSAISTPKHVNVINDAFSFARQRGLWFTDRIEREMRSSMVGLTVLPMQVGHVICFQNNNGNLFCLKAVNRKAQCKSTDDPSLTNSLKSFEKSLLKTTVTNSENSSSVKYIEGVRFNCCDGKAGETIQGGGKWDELVWNINSISKLKGYSKFYVHDETLGKKGTKKQKSFLSYFLTQDQEILSDEYINSCCDPTSETLLAEWNENKEETDNCRPNWLMRKLVNNRVDPVWRYRMCPNFLNVEGIVPPLLDCIETDHTTATTTPITTTTTNNNNNSNNTVNGLDISAANDMLNNTNNRSKNNSLLANDSAAENVGETSTSAVKIKIKSKKRKSLADGF